MRLSRNIKLGCGHDERLATLHRGEESAFCPVCETDVNVTRIPDPDFEAQMAAAKRWES